MSCYEWERGTLRLPSAAVVPLKKAVREANNAYRMEIQNECKRIWTDVLKRTKSTKRYRERLMAHMAAVGAGHEVYWILDSLSESPRQIQEADLDKFYEKATNRTTYFALSGATIMFEGNEVTWSVEEGNRAVDNAHAHPIAKAFFSALARIEWTRGSGGEIVGNDEYNRESDAPGGGGNYTTAYYGRLSGTHNRPLVSR